MSFGTVAILGPGLIGGSLALALAERGLAEKLVIYARTDKSFSAIKEKLPQVELTTDPAKAIKDADVVVLCLPIETMFKFVCPIAHLFKPTALVTDVGSVKGVVERDMAPLFAPNAHWIGSHPMAGSEKSGFNAARDNLFQDATVVITPTSKTSLLAEKRAREFWQALGGRVISLSPETHDDYVAQISHLPHLMASALSSFPSDEARELAGGGFRDTTRIASGSPELWTEILSENAGPLIKQLDLFIRKLADLRSVLTDINEHKSETICETKKSVLFGELEKAQLARSQLFNPKSYPEKKP